MDEDSVEEYFLTHHKANIIQLLQDADVRKHYSININFVELFENDTNLGNTILKNPEEALDELDQWILYVQDVLIETLNDSNLQHKLNVHARVYGLPACPELHRTVFPKNEDLDLFLQVTGTVVRVTATKMLEYQRPYICTKCKHIEMIEAIYDQKYIINPPKKCVNPEKCTGTNLISAGDLNVDNCKDYQEIKIQEQPSKLGIGTMPASMWVTLEDDLVDASKPGDDVTICGIVKRRWGPLIPGKRIEVELVLKANHIQVNNGQTSPSLITPEVRQQFIAFWEKYKSYPLEGRDLILKSFCPKLYGMYIVKLAMAVVLAGGSRCTQGNEVGIQIRSEPHILLVGDPGTGKSQLLRYAAKVIPRSVLTTGVGTTSAGLTVAAIMENGQWQLEGGALVLADGGICCIDEFNSMQPHDRTSIHEAMEQQTISVAKASMVCKLRTRCSILAATNPKGGHLDPSQPLSLNLALPSPLLSRFDIVLMLKDCYDDEWDDVVADYILSGKGIDAINVDPSLWNLEMLQQYFTIIRSVNPTLTLQANKILSSYYQAQRRAVARNKARTTMRLLDSLVRLSQAHARLMFHTEVHVMDALFAVILTESSMHGECAVLSINAINVLANFFTAPMENYTQIAKSVLSKLGLHDILRNEIMFLSNGCKYNPELSVHNEQTLSNNGNSETTFGESSLRNDEDNNVPTTSTVTDLEVIESPEKPNQIQDEFDNQNSLEDTENDVNKSGSETEKENIQSINKHNVVDITDFKQPNKPKTVNKKVKEMKHKKVVEMKSPEIDALSDKNIERNKRKNVKPHEQSKQPKFAKNTSNLNDFQMLNLIRSVNDEFDLSVLDFSGGPEFASDEAFQVENEENLPDLKDNNEFDKDRKDENPLVSMVNVKNKEMSRKINDKAENEDKHIENFKSAKPISESGKEKLSQNTKLRQFREKFSFKPRNTSKLVNCEKISEKKVEVSSDINCDKIKNDKENQTQTSYSVFNSQYEDYDVLDFDF